MDFSKSEENEKFVLREDHTDEGVIEIDHRTKTDVVRLEEEQKEDEHSISTFRMLLPQILAVSIVSLILVEVGMVLAFPTIIIPDLLKSTGILKFTKDEASWFGSVTFLCQPLGSLFSGFLFDPVGRKKTMLYVNFPLLVGWLLIRFSTTITHLYVGAVILGIAIGFMDAPQITYIGEITQPKWRGILTSYAELFVALGFCLVYFVGTAATWRTVSTICSSVPAIAIILISQIPESPIWLLSKGKKKESERSLCWLRGWVRPDVVRKEFSDLIQYNKNKEACVTEKSSLNLHNRKGMSFRKIIFYKIGFDTIFHRSVFQPLLLVVAYFGFSHVAGVTSTRPFMVDILEEIGTPLSAEWVTAISSVVGITGLIIGMVLIPKIGKRLLSLISMFGCSVTNCLLAVFGFFYTDSYKPLIQVILFVLLNFIWSVGIGQIPWILVCEVFPFKGRGVASGISAALSYALAFVFTKTYYSTYNCFTLPGVFGFYSICTFFGGLYLYYFLPETEGKTLEQIECIVEKHFNKAKTEEVTLVDKKFSTNP